ncbi:MAG: DNA-dependent RNA polymerase auxiliary subunit epsilon family protein [Streptococcaceae bacterium]|jgi:DNA-dependent RNA polymerase auxiliary subunit epsilon|nr:DNA-dependent RNA polymerase auxiliary subunit epsilon family protein [Streptococcaceae bacterium]
MIFKVYYQETRDRNPKREATKSLFIEAKDLIEARARIEENTTYNIELIQELSENALAYEKENTEFKLVEL